MTTLRVLLYCSGAFAVVLGVLHFTFPRRFGFMRAIPLDGAPLPPFRLSFYRYDKSRPSPLCPARSIPPVAAAAAGADHSMPECGLRAPPFGI